MKVKNVDIRKILGWVFAYLILGTVIYVLSKKFLPEDLNTLSILSLF